MEVWVVRGVVGWFLLGRLRKDILIIFNFILLIICELMTSLNPLLSIFSFFQDTKNYLQRWDKIDHLTKLHWQSMYPIKIDLETHRKVSFLFFWKLMTRTSWYGNWIENNFFTFFYRQRWEREMKNFIFFKKPNHHLFNSSIFPICSRQRWSFKQ